MKKNMSFKIIATVGLWAAIGLTACKAPRSLQMGNVPYCQKEMGIPMTLHL